MGELYNITCAFNDVLEHKSQINAIQFDVEISTRVAVERRRCTTGTEAGTRHIFHWGGPGSAR